MRLPVKAQCVYMTLTTTLCLQVKAQWVYMALVVDRILLYAYLGVCGFSTVFIYMNAPALYDRKEPIE